MCLLTDIGEPWKLEFLLNDINIIIIFTLSNIFYIRFSFSAFLSTHPELFGLSSTADDFYDHLSAPLAGGLDAVLNGEDKEDFIDLQMVKHHESEVSSNTAVT